MECCNMDVLIGQGRCNKTTRDQKQDGFVTLKGSRRSAETCISLRTHLWGMYLHEVDKARDCYLVAKS